MPVDPALQPAPTDFDITSLQKINALNFGLAQAPDPSWAPSLSDSQHASLQKINALAYAQAGGVPAAGGIGMAYGYFGATPVVADGNHHLISTIDGAGGVYGNAALFTAVPNGIEIATPAIVSIMLWAKEDSPVINEKLLAVQLDKQQGAIDPSKLLVRVPTGFIWQVACAVYNGILLGGDIVRGVAMAPVASGDFNIIDGYATVLAVPVSI